MFELELQEWLPYLLTIGWICAVAGLYSAHLHTVSATIIRSDDEKGMLIATERRIVAIAAVVQKRLVRHIKRKDAPEEDDPECNASLVQARSNQRGGAICPIDHSSLPGIAG
ncbi:hypothetical protein D3P07_18375 [Paenibacillus sp. 1011MAR3C5]|uniref:hypothetical protein n=1 Tax=Paenibacillus sp. 1011MAR3C5 TaxID=1675787 RepID=UPI000E6D3CC8|nr:hypothetical protein [Paenibacillus sp. 1011MAR3C5]RJE86053.1 hypothetical protein D3P07_18375 [Paenibacillus sp. 1011MAR3C5]